MILSRRPWQALCLNHRWHTWATDTINSIPVHPPPFNHRHCKHGSTYDCMWKVACSMRGRINIHLYGSYTNWCQFKDAPINTLFKVTFHRDKTVVESHVDKTLIGISITSGRYHIQAMDALIFIVASDESLYRRVSIVPMPDSHMIYAYNYIDLPSDECNSKRYDNTTYESVTKPGHTVSLCDIQKMIGNQEDYAQFMALFEAANVRTPDARIHVWRALKFE